MKYPYEIIVTDELSMSHGVKDGDLWLLERVIGIKFLTNRITAGDSKRTHRAAVGLPQTPAISSFARRVRSQKTAEKNIT
jgi:hypothetical protein